MPLLVEIWNNHPPRGWAAWFQPKNSAEAQQLDLRHIPGVRFRELDQETIDYLIAKAHADRALTAYLDAHRKAYDLQLKLKERPRC